MSASRDDPVPQPPFGADRDRLAAVLSSLPDGLLILDGGGRVTEVNDAFRTMTGRDCWPSEARGALDAALRACGDGTATCDLTLPRAGGGDVPAIVSIAAVPGEGGAPAAYVVTVKDVTARVRRERVHAALRRVGAVVAVGAPVDAVLDRIARELARLAGGGAAAVVRGSGEAAVVRGSGEAAVVVAASGGEAAGGLAAGVPVAGERWGELRVAPAAGGALPEGLGEVMETLADMAATALVAERARALTVARAGADPLVGLPDARAFADLIERESERSRRYSRPLALVLIDIDGFRRVNDRHGQTLADGVLRELAGRLQAHVRGSDWIGRTGGDEYAWLLPETGEDAARDAAARLRRALAEEPFHAVGYLTASLGISSTATAEGAADLYRQAEVALHWAKVSGRNRAVAYSFHVAEEVFSRRGADRAEAPSLRAMRALAWAVDAKDPHTNRHSQRVADLAVQLATALGWTVARSAQLREAGLVHDVGKIAVPDRILFKRGPLSEDEYAQICSHAAIGARIVADVLSPEQAAWVRSHHERWDGRGYPDGLRGEEIPEEARLLALADCWDVIVSARAYKPSHTAQEALAEVRRCSGIQFWPVAVAALERLVAAGAVRGGGADPPGPAIPAPPARAFVS